MVRLYFLCWLSLAVSTPVQIQSFHPSGHNEITYSVNIPEATAQSGSGSIYFKLNTTRQVRWFALGQGTGMPGANIFAVYTKGGNITVSPIWVWPRSSRCTTRMLRSRSWMTVEFMME